MTYPFDAAGPTDPPREHVGADVPCRKCAYNLRGLSQSGRCPECGAPVGLSIQGDLLRFSAPNWLDTLRRGVRLILGAVVLILGAVTAAGHEMWLLGSVLIAAAGVVWTIGGWLLTAPDPSGVGEHQYGAARKVIRASLVVAAVSQLLELFQVVPVPAHAGLALAAFAVIAEIVIVVGQFAQLQYLKKLARRIPDEALSEHAQFLTWAAGICYGLLLAGRAANAIVGDTGDAMRILGCCMGFDIVVLVIFGIILLFTLEKFAMHFGEQAAAARRTWAAPAA